MTAGTLAAQDAADLFNKLDANKDGYVTPDEVQESQKALFERMLRNADKDGDKRLSKEEFQAGLKPDETPKQPLAGGQPFGGAPQAAKGKGDPRAFFERLDANKDGKLSRDELPEQLRANFDRLDANTDGSLNPEELAQAGRQFGKRPPGAPGTPPPQAGRPAGGAPADRAQLEALFDRTDSNSDGKLTKDEIPEERQGMRGVLERSGGDSLTKEQFVRALEGTVFGGMMVRSAQADGQPPRPEGAPPRRPDGPPGGLPGGLFAALDSDKDGQLSTAEIVAAGTTLLKLDRNGDGKLTPEEVFGPGAGPPPGRPGNGLPPAARPAEAGPGVGQPGRGFSIEAFDKDKDGKISKEEAPDRLKERFEQVDSNSDGFIDQAEFRQMTERMQKAGGKTKGKRPDPNNN